MVKSSMIFVKISRKIGQSQLFWSKSLRFWIKNGEYRVEQSSVELSLASLVSSVNMARDKRKDASGKARQGKGQSKISSKAM